jgi:hypothetical protein
MGDASLVRGLDDGSCLIVVIEVEQAITNDQLLTEDSAIIVFCERVSRVGANFFHRFLL